ncbi:hypothetical protein NBH00_18425 [Paraconexibacter antarcticus]|uniref:Antitoxin Xre/MbcA/ParS-like toxin-binding domain-containing protein n=1 Tax=Paraconexibacter antarcticus TaxID=2949664 RepID=A0ABY5DMT2_9ACTN|nr:hypothetical protein [Paraconexibacter antarcticus]UTI63321.1 hypothetical protein NBH00_18425 [Paraconexibacter antarcticus]
MTDDLISRFVMLPSPARRRPRTKQEAVSQIMESEQRVIGQLPRAQVDVLWDKVLGARDGIDDATARTISPVTGEAQPTAEETVAALKDNMLKEFALRRRVIEACLSAADVAAMFGASRQTPHDRFRAGTLLAIKDRGQLRFPLWQFDPQAADGVVEGLDRVLAALPITQPLGRVLWFMTPKPQLQGRAPIQVLQDGDVDRVVAEAQAVYAK